jgi:hypothetical protein
MGSEFPRGPPPFFHHHDHHYLSNQRLDASPVCLIGHLWHFFSPHPEGFQTWVSSLMCAEISELRVLRVYLTKICTE